jgi:hypothetical protein
VPAVKFHDACSNLITSLATLIRRYTNTLGWVKRSDVSYWPIADMGCRTAHVRFWG